MPGDIFNDLNNLRMVLDTETDADSPDNETTYNGIRYMLEALYILGYSTGVSGTASQNPGNGSSGHFYDNTKSWVNDEHNGRTLLIKSGSAKGNFYMIDDTAGTSRLDCTGDNLYSDGVRSGDYYEIFYDLKNNSSGHDHDGVNSAPAILEDGQVVLTSISPEDASEVSTQNGTWTTVKTVRMYVPNTARKLYFSAEIKQTTDPTYYAYVRLNYGGSSSDDASTQSASYVWVDLSGAGLDLSGVSEGWITLNIQLYIGNAVGGRTAYLRAYSIMWGT